MLLSDRITRQLLEAAEDAGFDLAEALRPLGLTEKELRDPPVGLEWNVLAEIMAQLEKLAGGDEDRLKNIGRCMSRVPAYAPLRRVANSVVSVRRLYELATKWIAPVSFPHLPLTTHFVGDRKLVIHAEVPSTYAPSATFFHIFEGVLTQVPRMVGAEAAVISESRITPRTCDLVIELPHQPTLLERVKRSMRAMLAAPDALQVLEEHRKELAENVEALQRARDELRVLLDRLPDLVVVHVAGKIVWANRAYVATLGYGRLDELIGRSILDDVALEFREQVSARMREPVGARADHHLNEVALETRTGARLVVEVSPPQAVVFEGVNARLVLGRDVSERVRMQQKLIVADRLASVGLLAAGVAHEVNNPLGYVLNNIEIARRELAPIGERAEVARQVLSVALEGVDRIRNIVRDLLMLARGDDAAVAAIDVRAVAESTLALAAREIERSARLVLDFRPAPLVTSSESRIAQVLLNLIVNALEAMRDRPREENELVVRIAPAGDERLLLEVSDNGPGISPSDLSRVFEPFFTTKPAGQGTGLGLAIVQRLVVEIGGEINVSSTPGRGTTFRVLLPATRVH
ncbi:MAG: two-component system sensor histidine kinase NtrB [Polyangiales bacterium]